MAQNGSNNQKAQTVFVMHALPVKVFPLSTGSWI